MVIFIPSDNFDCLLLSCSLHHINVLLLSTLMSWLFPGSVSLHPTFFFFLFFFYLFKFSLKSVQIFLPEFTASEYFFFVLILFTASFLPSPLLCKYPADISFICSLRSRCTLHFTCLNPHPGHICISWWEKPEYTQFSLPLHSTPCLSFHKNETKFPGQKDTSQLYLISGHTKGIARCMAVSSCTSILSVSKYFLTVPEQCCIS